MFIKLTHGSTKGATSIWINADHIVRFAEAEDGKKGKTRIVLNENASDSKPIFYVLEAAEDIAKALGV